MITRPLLSATRSLAHHRPSCLFTQADTCLAISSSPPPQHHPRPRPCPPNRRLFSQTPLLCAEASHYDTLGVTPTATKADLKKRFYILSKETHPDVNKSDPNAADRFSRVSEAYSILGNDDKRAAYDRDVMPRFARSTSRSSSSSGRYAGHAGSRPATGLSKRRGTFRGPPPSFYSRPAQNDAEAQQRESDAFAAGFGAGQPGSFDPRAYASSGQWDPAFNPEPIHKTQTAEDVRRMHRRAAEMAAAQAYAHDEGNFWARFVIVSAVIAFGIGLGTMVTRMSGTPRGGLVKADGSRREKRLGPA